MLTGGAGGVGTAATARRSTAGTRGIRDRDGVPDRRRAAGGAVRLLVRLRRDGGLAPWIRRQRLEHARRDLANPMLRQLPVHGVAARWGFSHHAVFTRTFTAAYGVPPAGYRQRALAPCVLPAPRHPGPPG
jgi:Helix-turn-helix domain